MSPRAARRDIYHPLGNWMDMDVLREMTQEELADRAGLSSRYLGSIERGAVSASVTVLGRLAQALRVSPCELIAPPQLRKSLRSRSVGKD
jgi:transcriptional regulator with XRE-family HTH domain